jgi:hypothetical protein
MTYMTYSYVHMFPCTQYRSSRENILRWCFPDLRLLRLAPMGPCSLLYLYPVCPVDVLVVLDTAVTKKPVLYRVV